MFSKFKHFFENRRVSNNNSFAQEMNFHKMTMGDFKVVANNNRPLFPNNQSVQQILNWKNNTKVCMLVVVDGLRKEDLDYDRLTFLKEIRDHTGACCENFRVAGRTLTIPGHIQLTSGKNPTDITNTEGELMKYPGFYQYAINQIPGSEAFVICSKGKLCCLGDCKKHSFSQARVCNHTIGVNYRLKNKPHLYAGVQNSCSGYREDKRTLARSLEALHDSKNATGPVFLVINFREPDSSGHRGDWNEYIRQQGVVNDYLRKLWSEATVLHGDSVSMFITNDHGRHSDNFAQHGCDCEGCRSIMFYAMGPGIKRGEVFGSGFDVPYCQNDIPLTIASLYGIAMSPDQFQTVNYRGEEQKHKFMWDMFTPEIQRNLLKEFF
jgi:hypothetical protein